jgi:hypothetical protein
LSQKLLFGALRRFFTGTGTRRGAASQKARGDNTEAKISKFAIICSASTLQGPLAPEGASSLMTSITR